MKITKLTKSKLFLEVRILNSSKMTSELLGLPFLYI